MFKGLKQRGSWWHLRRRVPAEYLQSWGHAEVNRALGTESYKVACKLVPKVWGDLEHHCLAERQFRLVHAVGMLMQQEPEVGGRMVGGGD